MNRNDPTSLRAHIDGPALLRKYSEVTYYLLLGFKPIYEQPVGNLDLAHRTLEIVDWAPLTSTDVRRLDKVLQSLHRLINKILPELKSVDVTDNTTQRESVTPTEKAARLLAALNGLRNQPGGAEVIDGLGLNAGLVPTIRQQVPAVFPRNHSNNGPTVN